MPNGHPAVQGRIKDGWKHASQAVISAEIAIRLQLTESFTRKYQVAENRTHPEMNAYPPTGYLLSGANMALKLSEPDDCCRK